MDTTRATDVHSLLGTARQLVIGAAVGLVVFGIPFAAYWLVADTQLGVDLDEEDGLFEWIGAGALLVAALLQAILFHRSDVPRERRLLPFMRRNPFYLGLAIVLFLAFAEEISWGQRIFGWATPTDLPFDNLQGETNIHNLALFHGESLFNLHRLFNLFWMSYAVVLPLLVGAVPIVARLCQRISLPVPPAWIGGLFVGAFVAWRLYDAFEPAGALAGGQELSEAALAVCFAALGAAQLLGIQRIPSLAPPATHRLAI